MNIWVYAQESNGAPTTATLELLTKARSLSSSVTAFVGGDAGSLAATLGEFGAAKVYATGDLGGKLPGVAVSAAIKAVIDGYRDLVENEGCLIVIGPMISENAVALKPYINSHGQVPAIAWCGTDD